MSLETKLDPRLWEAIRGTYGERNFTGAILDAMYFLSDLIRERSGLESDGVPLVGQAFGGESPKLKVTKLQSESDWSVQKGTEQLLRGIYQAIRNPRSHGKISDTELDSEAIILFVNHLTKLIGQSKSPFSKSAFLARVFDPDFVASERYAQLLVNEIPVKKRLEIFLDAYRTKNAEASNNLRYFFSALFLKLEDTEKLLVYDEISEELKHTDDESVIRTIIQACDPGLWPFLDEAARLRIENKLIKSIKDGLYLRSNGKCRAGSLGTWAPRLFPFFTLKREAYRVIRSKLSSANAAEQDYVLTYLFTSLDSLSESPALLENNLIKALKAGDQRFYDALNWAWLWEDAKWSDIMKAAVENFQPAEPTPSDDEIPF